MLQQQMTLLCHRASGYEQRRRSKCSTVLCLNPAYLSSVGSVRRRDSSRLNIRSSLTGQERAFPAQLPRNDANEPCYSHQEKDGTNARPLLASIGTILEIGQLPLPTTSQLPDYQCLSEVLLSVFCVEIFAQSLLVDRPTMQVLSTAILCEEVST